MVKPVTDTRTVRLVGGPLDGQTHKTEWWFGKSFVVPRRDVDGRYWRDVYDRKGRDGDVLLFIFRESEDCTEAMLAAEERIRRLPLEIIMGDDE